jgi:hypothetical protein
MLYQCNDQSDSQCSIKNFLFGVKNLIIANITKCIIDVNWGLVVKLALPRKVTRRAYKVFGIYDTNVQFNHKFKATLSLTIHI